MKIVAHRGAATVAPENTMAAFAAARALGADGVELDVHATADGELVVLHDHTVDRTTDGAGRIFDLSMAEVGRLDAGSWFSSDFAGEPVPRLAEVVALERLELEVELRTFTRPSMLGALRLVEEAGALDRTEFTSWNTPMLMALKAAHAGARIGLFSRRREPWMPAGVFDRLVLSAAEFTPAEVVHVHAADLTPAIAAELHDLGRTVHANDAASIDDLRRAVDCGADRTSVADCALAVAFRGATPT